VESPTWMTAVGRLASLIDGASKNRTSELLEDIHRVLTKHGFQMDEARTEVAWVFASEKPEPHREKAAWRKLEWRGIFRAFDIHAKPVRWLGFPIDPRFNWQAHIRHRIALGRHRLRAVSRVMSASGIPGNSLGRLLGLSRYPQQRTAWRLPGMTSKGFRQAHCRSRTGRGRNVQRRQG